MRKSVFSTYPIRGYEEGGWSLSQLSWDERWDTPWTDRQSVAGQTQRGTTTRTDIRLQHFFNSCVDLAHYTLIPAQYCSLLDKKKQEL